MRKSSARLTAFAGISRFLGRKRGRLYQKHGVDMELLFIGSSTTAVQALLAGDVDVGADTFLGEFTFGLLEQKQALKSLRLFAEQVMPELESLILTR
jgi:hypothetical protein